jgi:hypothetical protein
MNCAVCKSLLLSLSFFLLTISANAQNMMNHVYSNNAIGDANRGDFNEDGIPDVVLMTPTGVNIGLSNSQGKLTFRSFATNAQDGNGGEVSVAKFTSSGHLDVAVLTGTAEGGPNSVDILLGKGDGTFELGQSVKLPAGVRVGVVTTSDFNGDGKADMAMFEYLGSRIFLFTGRGDGTFDPARVISTALSDGTDAIEAGNMFVGDFDGDGRPDLLIADTSRAAILFNNGNLNFQRKDATDKSGMIYDFAALDVNQDGYTDFIVSYLSSCPPDNTACNGGYAVYLSQGSSRSFKVSYSLPPSFDIDPPQQPGVADVDGDGINDFVYITQFSLSRLQVAKGNPDGTYQAAKPFVLSNTDGGFALITLDLNRDGRPDFLTTNEFNGEVYTSLNAFPRSPCANSKMSPSVTVCQPAADTYSKSPLHVVAKTTDTTHPVTAVQIYVDGQLKNTTNAASIDTTLALPLGDHVLSVKAWDSSGKNFRSVRRVTIYNGTPGQVCSTAPDTVHICAPAQNASATSPVRIFAASGTTAEPTAMQVYLDHQLVFSDDSADNFIDHMFTLKAGAHSLTVKGWDANGQQLSQSETIRVTQ